jgi:hypothetical protein
MTVPAEVAYTVPEARSGTPWFRIFRIDLDDSEEMAVVHAICDPATLDVVRALAPGAHVTGNGKFHAELTLPAAVALELKRVTAQVRATEPRWPHTHVVNESLNWVFHYALRGRER